MPSTVSNSAPISVISGEPAKIRGSAPAVSATARKLRSPTRCARNLPSTRCALPITPTTGFLEVTALSNHCIIIRMRADPEPDQIAVGFDCQCTIAQPHAHRPEPPNLLELQGGMLWISLEQLIVFVGEDTHLLGELFVILPKGPACQVPHISRARPVRTSPMA